MFIVRRVTLMMAFAVIFISLFQFESRLMEIVFLNLNGKHGVPSALNWPLSVVRDCFIEMLAVTSSIKMGRLTVNYIILRNTMF